MIVTGSAPATRGWMSGEASDEQDTWSKSGPIGLKEQGGRPAPSHT